ncbi:MAG: TonB-dependent receptor domain-containing protein [Flavobacteriaceae bacterium]
MDSCLTRVFIFILLTFGIAFAFANTSSEQKTGTLTGKVYDAALNQPLPYVNVLLLNEARKTLMGTITDENGLFKIDGIHEGKHIVSVQYIGFETIEKPVVIGKQIYKVDTGVLCLIESLTALDEVEVIAEVSTIEQKVDRKVITIGKDLAAAGTASELMVGIPSVSVDPQNGAISLRGNENVRVLVDGRLSNIPAAQLLKQIPSSAIKSIELITNPSAKYNPEGMSGIINIVPHKNQMLGFNGSLSANWSYDINPKFNSGLNLNYRNGKFNLYGNYSNNFSKNDNNGHINRTNNTSRQLFEFNEDRSSQIFKVGLDFYMDEKNTLSVFTSLNPTKNRSLGISKAFFENDATKDEHQIFDANGTNESTQYNFNFKHDFAKEGSNIELEVDHNLFDEDRPVPFVYPTNPTQNYTDQNKPTRVRTTINLDYVNPLTEKSKLELGAEARLFNSLIEFSSDQLLRDENGRQITYRDIDFDYTRDIYSLYATYGKKLDKWTYQFGLRAESVRVDALAKENSTVSGTSQLSSFPFENNYTELYPSMYVTYSPTAKKSYQLSYSRRIDRPGLGQINPIKEWSTPLVSSYGNQVLRPQFTNSFELNYTRRLKKGSFTTGVFYRFISEEINRVVLVDRADVGSGRVIITHDNFDDTSAFGLELSSNYRPYKWWSINGSFDLFSQTQKGVAERLSKPIDTATKDDIETIINTVDNVAYNFRMFNSFTATKKLSFTAFMFYRGRNKTLQFDVLPMYFVNIGARLKILKGKGNISLNYNDIFNTMRFGFEGRLPYPQNGRFYWESQTIQLGFNYRFGSNKYQARSRRESDSDEKNSGGGMF